MIIRNLIGRTALYSLTFFLIGSFISFALVFIWLFIDLDFFPTQESLFKFVFTISIVSGLVLFFTLFVFHRIFVPERNFIYTPLGGAKINVGLTAYNDEICIGDAIADFKNSHLVNNIIVVDNNSNDNTKSVAINANADRIVTELQPGYGSCCMRALDECAKNMDDGDIIILCEGDMTFSSNDIGKYLAYLENCDIVLGTRSTQELRESNTQMDWLINPANQIVAKLIQTRFWGSRLTDVGCTYRALRVCTYKKLKNKLHVNGDHFSPHMFIEALKLDMRIIEIPVVFRLRSGTSKGVGSNKIKAMKVATKMLGLIYSS